MEVDETEATLALATGFIYEHEDVYYLITNGHNFTGINPETNIRLANHAGYPTRITMSVRSKVNFEKLIPGQMRTRPDEIIARLYEDEDYTQPLWYIHPKHGYQVDVIALPLCHKEDLRGSLLLYPINKYGGFAPETGFIPEPEVADDVYIIGYPFGITHNVTLPVWKRGSVATEPNFDYKGLPRMLVDTATRSGMSGSPVILARTGVHNLFGEVTPDKQMIGTVYRFLGVYSGRLLEQESDAQLGIVWRTEVIEEILVAKCPGTIGFQTV